ncbi:MAG TPA: hypothetical protein VGK35_04155 [Actinotalea sp.]
MTRLVTGLLLLASAAVGVVVVALLGARDGGVDPILVAVAVAGLVAAAALVVGDLLWSRRASRQPSDESRGVAG